MAFFLALDRLLRLTYRFCGALAAVALVTLTLCIILSIVTRLMGVYIPGLTEYSGYSMAATGFLALAYTFQAHGHIRVGLLLNALHGRNRHILQLWCLGAATFFSIYLAYYLCRMTYVSWQLGDVSEGADAIHLWIPQTFTAVGAVILAVCVVHNLINALLGREIGDESVAPAEMAGDT